MSKISLTIEYAGMQLQIAKNEAGEEVTPLKPISDLFGLEWRRQYKKLTESEHMSRYLGVCVVHMYHADGQKREQVCILLSRVSAFMMAINPDRVRSAGNETGADFLIEKLNEWADALHDYEALGVAINKNQMGAAKLELARINALVRLQTVKNRTESKHDRKALTEAQKVLSKELGLPVQSDLVDGQ